MTGGWQPRDVEPHQDQYFGAQGTAQDLVLGLDFGSCWTKVVIQRPWASHAVAIPATTARSGDYLTPTAWRLVEGSAELCEHDAESAVVDSKLALMDAVGRTDVAQSGAVANAALFLALVIRHSRQWYMRHQQAVLRGAPLTWSLHVGSPSAGYDDLEVKRLFEAAATAGWQLSLTPGPVTSDASRRAATEAIRGPTAEHVRVIPEVIAEVIGYAKSPRRREGLHLIVDVGGRTLDVCGFVIHHNRETLDRVYGILTARVERLGVVELTQRRRMARGHDEDASQALREASREPVLGDAADEVARAPDAAMQQAVRRVMGEVVDALRVNRDPNAPHWREGLPTFVCGGGAVARCYRQAVAQLDEDLRRHTWRAGLLLLDSIELEWWDRQLPVEIQRRLGVAYGLSWDVLDIGEIRPPRDIADIPRPVPGPRNCVCDGNWDQCSICHGRGVIEPDDVPTAAVAAARIPAVARPRPRNNGGARAPVRAARAPTAPPPQPAGAVPDDRLLARALLTRMHGAAPPKSRISLSCPLCRQPGFAWTDLDDHLRVAHQLTVIGGVMAREYYEETLLRRIDGDPSFRRRVLCSQCNFVPDAMSFRLHLHQYHRRRSRR